MNHLIWCFNLNARIVHFTWKARTKENVLIVWSHEVTTCNISEVKHICKVSNWSLAKNRAHSCINNMPFFLNLSTTVPVLTLTKCIENFICDKHDLTSDIKHFLSVFIKSCFYPHIWNIKSSKLYTKILRVGSFIIKVYKETHTQIKNCLPGMSLCCLKQKEFSWS